MVTQEARHEAKQHRLVPRSDYLIIVRAGKRSLHPQWVGAAGERMNFDILVAAFEDGVPAVRHEQVFQVPGVGATKVEGLGRVLQDYSEFVRSYRAVAMIDDDVAANAPTLSRCFETGDELNLQIWQPALTHNSYFTYAAFLQNPAFSWRYVNFIEMMCPFFSRKKLAEVAFLFHQGYESGIDLVWCNLGYRDWRSFAVLDCCCVHHTLPVGALKERNGFIGGRRYEDDIERILIEYDVPWLSCVPYACVGKDGTIVSSRLGMFARSVLPLLSALRASSSAGRLRAVLVHWKHLLTRPARNCELAPLGVAADARAA